MAFPSGWGRKQKITIQSSQVAGTGSHTNFPVAIGLDHLDTEIVNAGSNSALEGGGDIRFSLDSAGTNQLPCEVQRFHPDTTEGNRRCLIWVKVPSLSTSSNTDIYIWYNKNGETQPAVTDSYGRNSVWGDYEAVLHLNDGGTTGPWVDSTGNGHDATLTTGTSITNTESGHPFDDNWLDFTAAEVLTLGSSTTMLNGGAMTLQYWINADVTGNGDGTFGNRHSGSDTHWIQMLAYERGFVKATGTEDIVDDGSISTGTTLLNVLTHDSSSLVFYNGGTAVATDSTIAVTSGITSSSPFRIGTYYEDSSSFRYDGRIGECRALSTKLDADWVATEYNNMNSPASFASAGTPEMALDPSSDQHWDNVVLLTRFNDSLTDSSTSGHTASADGGETLVSSLNNTGKFGEAAQFVTDQVLHYKDNASDFQFGTGDFTVEAWIKQSSSKAVNPVIGSYNYNRSGGGAGNWLLYVGSNRLILASGATGSASTLLQGSTANVSASDWVHVAVSRQGTSLKLFVDGSEVGVLTSNSTDFNDAGGITIGNYLDSGNTQFDGFVDEIRVTKGVARYTGNFTAPTTGFPEGGDEYWNNVTLLLHADETSAPYIDSSSYGHTVTNNSVTTSDTIKKFGDRSFGFSSSSTYLDIANHDGFIFGTEPFTIEFWFYPTGTGSYPPLLGSTNAVNSDTWLIRYNPGVNNNVVLYIGAISNSTPFLSSNNGIFTDDQWHHIAVTRDSSDNTRLFVNGVLEDEFLSQPYNMTNNNNHSLAIGKQYSIPSAYTVGNMDEIRITKGVARYTANFTPPTEAFSSTGSSGGSGGSGGDTVYWDDVANKPSTFPPSSHDHDDRYYTETEVDTLLGNKSDTSHTHDDRYYTETEMDALLSGKSDTSHTHGWVDITGKPSEFNPSSHDHDDRYYTEAEVDTFLSAKASSTHNHDSDYVNVSGDTMTGALNFTDGNTKILEGSSNRLRIQTNYGYVDVGAGNSSYCHFDTDRNDFYFNTNVQVNGQIKRYTDGAFTYHDDPALSSGKITVSTSGPSGGSNGDIWMEVD